MPAALSKRDFTRARHAQDRELIRACRAAIGATSWGSRQGVLYAERAGWFVAVHPLTDLLRERTLARVVVKPTASDPIFWDLVGHPDLRRQGLSFRYFGAMTTAGMILEELEIPEDGGCQAIAGRLLELGEQRLETIAQTWTVDDFLDRLPTSDGGRYYTARISALLAFGRDGEARHLSAQSAAGGFSGGFVSSTRGTLNEMAERFIAGRTFPAEPS